MNRIEMLRILFYYAAIISIMLGSYGLFMNHRAQLNRVFFAVCITLSLWGFGFSMAIDADSVAACLFWRRFSAVGWGLMFAFILHFCIVYSGKSSLLLKKWNYFILYFPPAIVIWVFALSNDLTKAQYHFIRTSNGWINYAYQTHWDTLFNIYYASYMLIGLSLVAWQIKKTSSDKVKRQGKLMLYSYLIALLIGSITDILGNVLFHAPVPQVAPIVILIPIVTIYYSIVRYGFLNPKNQSETDVILTTSTRVKVYNHLSNVLFAGGFVSYFVQYHYYNDYHSPLLSSLSIFMLGFFVRYIKSIHVSDSIKDRFLIALMFLSIPIIILIFLEFGGVTVWAASFLFIIIAMVFNRPAVLVSISVSVISTQILIWLLKPEVKLLLDRVDYLGRIGILCATIFIAYYMNKVFIQRLRDNTDQLNIQRFLSEVSSDFVNSNHYNIDEKISWVLRIVGKLYQIDRIELIRIESTKQIIEVTNFCTSATSGSFVHADFLMEKEEIPWLLEQISSNEYVLCQDLLLSESQTPALRHLLLEQGIRSNLYVPLMKKTDSMTFLHFASLDPRKMWQDEELRVLHLLGNMFSDALVKLDAEKEISFMAYHDHLTGLPNRRLLKDRINQAISLAKRSEKLLAVIFMDLDSFKSINDTLGHEGGDLLLKIVSEKLTKIVRQSDTVSRFGGDEFVIMVNHSTNENDIKRVVEKIMQALQAPIFIEGQEFHLTISVGVAVYPFDGFDMDTLIRNADIAMYKAKESGKNQYIFCTEDLRAEMLQKVKLTNSLYHALERQELTILYQPQIELQTERISGVEALLRWQHPELGLISPSVFIPIAEQIGVINQIGEWVLRCACIQNKKWQDAGYPPVVMAVNVSANQLRSMAIVDQLKRVIADTGLDPELIELEITESSTLDESSDVVGILHALREVGVDIAIDDFGTHYSSLGRLKDLPISKIKIDKKFIDGINASDKDNAIVKTIIDLAKHLALKVIAEGVEQEHQKLFLKKEQCDEIQGYFYYQPLTEQEITAALMGRS